MFKKIVQAFVDIIPGERIFGIYRFLPVFFVFGGALEFSMIHWKPGGTNFYTTYKRNQSEREAERQLKFEQYREKVFANINKNKGVCIMPAGLSWGSYIKFISAAIVTMCAGAQTVHQIYRPLDDFQEIVEEKKRFLKEEEN